MTYIDRIKTVALIFVVGVLGLSRLSLAANPGRPVLELSTRSTSVSAKKNLHLTVILRNASTHPIWIPKPLMGMRGTGGIEIVATDSREKTVKTRISIGDSFGKIDASKGSTLLDSHVLLAPGDFLGFERTLEEIGIGPLAPGRFSIRATFYTDSCADSKRLTKEAYSGGFEVACGDVNSDVIAIEIAGPDASQQGSHGQGSSDREFFH
jgi:hypothetical protein